VKTGEGQLIIAVTSSAPFSDSDEVFAQDEVSAMMAAGPPVVVVPMRIRRRTPNSAAAADGMAGRCVGIPLLSPAVIRGALSTLARRPGRSLRAMARALRASGSLRSFVVNLASMPKALWLADLVLSRRATQIHAYWLAHTATAAMVAAEIARVSWSASGFRWDIDASNALTPKLQSAQFIRCADELGYGQLTTLAARVPDSAPIVLVRTGVALPRRSVWASVQLQPTLLCCPAAFVEKKGHGFLLEATRRLVDRGYPMRLELFGDGPLRASIEGQADALGLGSVAVFHGNVPLFELRRFLNENRPTCVLASIRASDGQEEGIPVTLVEALANGAPVVSTRSGSIETLVLDGCGLLVPPGDPAALASAIAEVIDDVEAAAKRCETGYRRVLEEFDLKNTAARMADLISGAGVRGLKAPNCTSPSPPHGQ
jgi:colanic acid/amylovoran biosynthesis glycosyltransferase